MQETQLVQNFKAWEGLRYLAGRGANTWKEPGSLKDCVEQNDSCLPLLPAQSMVCGIGSKPLLY